MGPTYSFLWFSMHINFHQMCLILCKDANLFVHFKWERPLCMFHHFISLKSFICVKQIFIGVYKKIYIMDFVTVGLFRPTHKLTTVELGSRFTGQTLRHCFSIFYSKCSAKWMDDEHLIFFNLIEFLFISPWTRTPIKYICEAEFCKTALVINIFRCRSVRFSFAFYVSPF